MSHRTIVVERIFDADITLIWRALTEKELMKQWYIDAEDFKPVVGCTFEFWAGEEGEKQWKHVCEVMEVIHERKLTYSWQYEGYSGMSYVTFELFEKEKGTKLKLTHKGVDAFPAEVPALAVENFEKGWNEFVNVSLKEFLENIENN